MKAIFTLTIFFFFLIPQHLPGQQYLYDWQIGIGAGYLNYRGDIKTRLLYPDVKPSFSFHLSRKLSQAFTAEFSALNGSFIMDDRARKMDNSLITDWKNFDRALNVRTELYGGSITVQYHFDNGYILRRNSRIAPFIGLGLSYYRFTPFADLLWGTDNRYYYWSDLTIRDMAENTPDAGNSIIIDRDGVYETELRSLGTENVAYDNYLFGLPVTFGIKFKFSEHWNLHLSVLYNFTNTDFLDDVSNTPLTTFNSEFQQYAAFPSGRTSEYRGDPSGNKDHVYYTSISLRYNFGLKKKKFNTLSFYVRPEALMDRIVDQTSYIDNSDVEKVETLVQQEDTISEAQKLQATAILPVDDSLEYLQHEEKDSLIIKKLVMQLRKDTLATLKYEIEKYTLKNQLYLLKQYSPDPEIALKLRLDSQKTVAYYERLLHGDSMMIAPENEKIALDSMSSPGLADSLLIENKKELESDNLINDPDYRPSSKPQTVGNDRINIELALMATTLSQIQKGMDSNTNDENLEKEIIEVNRKLVELKEEIKKTPLEQDSIVRQNQENEIIRLNKEIEMLQSTIEKNRKGATDNNKLPDQEYP